MISKSTTQTLNCAIYTRKSTDEGLDKDYSSLDAQRDSAEAYIKSQSQEGWHCLGDRYDDGGFTGGNMERPALKRLIADIEAGKIDCVVVYKVDRLSRSLLDFARLLEVFERHHVAFVSVTQQFNTTNSMGRLMLNVLLSFAQFEREIISERTRDKMAAARRKGKWSGGMPLLGYDIDPRNSKLVINEAEATHVREIFELYLKHQSIMATIAELDRRSWTNKRWITKKGNERGGLRFTKATLFKLLTNVTYLGKLKYKDEVHEGEHTGIIAPETWQRVQTLLRRNGRTGGVASRNKYGALLKGILRCAACDSAMSPSHSTKKGNKRYRYYVCQHAQKRGWQNCPAPSITASEIENFVISQIKHIAQDQSLVDDIVIQARSQSQLQLDRLEIEQASLVRERREWNEAICQLAPTIGTGTNHPAIIDRLADLQERIQLAEKRLAEIRLQNNGLRCGIISHDDVSSALRSFDQVWATLTTKEQIRIVQLIIQKIDFDGKSGNVTITFHPEGIRTVANESSTEFKEVIT